MEGGGRMKKTLFSLLLILALIPALSALSGEVVYVEGTVDLRNSYGDLDYADIGMPVETGDTILTGLDGYAEMEMEDGSTVKVYEDSIFTLSSIERSGKQANSFQCVLGSVQYKFTQAMKENEPSISTPSTVCGLRGTEFTVVAGLDGSALYVVDDGSVAVTAQGEEVQLGAQEGVRVNAGEAPGDVFPVLRGEIDFSQFRRESREQFLENPAASMGIMIRQLEDYADEADRYKQEFEDQKKLVEELTEKMKTLEGDERKSFYKESVLPEEVKTSYLVLNYRYYALSGLSLRRYVVGSMYVDMRTRYILNKQDPVYNEFVEAYNEFLRVFENRITPYLVPADI